MRIASPFDPMLFLGFAVTAIIVDVEGLACRRERGVAQIVTDQPKIHLLIGLVTSRISQNRGRRSKGEWQHGRPTTAWSIASQCAQFCLRQELRDNPEIGR